MESAQLELHFQNVSPETNKLYIVETVGVTTGEVVRISGEAVGSTEAVETPEVVETPGAVETRDEAFVSSGFTVGKPGKVVEERKPVKTMEASVSVLTGTYPGVSLLVKRLNQTLKNAGHNGMMFNCLHAQSCNQVRQAGGKTLQQRKRQPESYPRHR